MELCLSRGSRIDKAGTRSEIERLITSDCEVIDARGGIVLPGFVDAHAHPVFAGNRADEFEERAAGHLSGNRGQRWRYQVDSAATRRERRRAV